MISKLFTLQVPDWVRAATMAVTVPVVGYIYGVIQNGSFNVSFQQIALLAVSGFLGYLIKQMGSSTTVTSVAQPSTPIIVTEKTFGVTVQTTPVETTLPVIK